MPEVIFVGKTVRIGGGDQLEVRLVLSVNAAGQPVPEIELGVIGGPVLFRTSTDDARILTQVISQATHTANKLVGDLRALRDGVASNDISQPTSMDPVPPIIDQLNPLEMVNQSSPPKPPHGENELVEVLRNPTKALKNPQKVTKRQLAKLMTLAFAGEKKIKSDVNAAFRRANIIATAAELQEVLNWLVQEGHITTKKAVSKKSGRPYTLYGFGVEVGQGKHQSQQNDHQSSFNDQLKGLEDLLTSFGGTVVGKTFVEEAEEREIDPTLAEQFLEQKIAEGFMLQTSEGTFQVIN